MDEEFYMPQLDRYRRIWIYLPPGYDSSDQEYPVLYMHDGQNIFDAGTSFLGIEWEVDETLNDLASQGYQVPIVVGIDNGGIHRTDELTPWNNPEYGGGEGDEYMAFIVETLKPYIDNNFRTLPDRDNTGILGSSLGGLISNYGALKYQDVFSKSGPFSPAYWINYDSIMNYVSVTGKKEEIRFYQNAGENEGDIYIDIMYRMEDSLKSVGFENISSKVIANGEHNEATWRDDFEAAYLYLFVSYANDIEDYRKFKSLFISPNPARSHIVINNHEIPGSFDLMILDSSGKVISKLSDYSSTTFDVSSLAPGLYIIHIRANDGKYAGRFIKK
jgi:predicted alpha/beta superfamily hydrolase